MMKTSKLPQCNTISDCNFIGVQYDAKTVNAIEKIAEGLIEHAIALGYLAQALKASNVPIEALLKINKKPLANKTRGKPDDSA